MTEANLRQVRRFTPRPMKHLPRAVFFILLLTGFGSLHGAPPPRPNILIMLADDLGWSDLGCYGGEIRTPHLDGIAADGMRFTQFYNCARCCPSRACLLTGLYPHQVGVGLMTSDRGAAFPGAGDEGLAYPGYRGSLNGNCVTLAQVLKSAGYHTAAAGKWHVGDQEWPTKRGFDDFYGFVGGYAVDSWEPRMMIRLPEGRPQRSYAAGEFYATDAITDHALDFLTGMHESGGPWLLYLAFQAPHFPVQAKKEDMAGYPEIYAQGWDHIREQRLARQKKLSLLPDDAPLTPRSRIPMPAVAARMGSMTVDGKNPAWETLPLERRADLAQRMSVYAGMITGVDRNVGRVLDYLRQSGQWEKTLILFLSDNGACAEWEPFGFEMKPTLNPKPGTGINQGTQALPNRLYQGEDLARLGAPGSYPSYGSGWANACNTPWRLYKHFAHEGGISTPLVVHWPGGLGQEGGRFCREPAHLVDLMATCVDLAGAKYPTESEGNKILPMEGVSLRPLLSSTPSSLPERPLFWEHEGNRAMRVGKWKLVAQVGLPWELYDMEADRAELHSVAENERERVTAMSAQWDAWAERTHVLPRPGKK